MKKTTLQHVLPLAFLMVSAAMITACEKGGPRTPEGAVLKAKCQRGFNTSAENQKLVETLSKNSNVPADAAIRTYITKFDIDPAKPSLLNPTSSSLVSTQKTEVFANSPDSDAITLTTNCENLSATLQGPNGLKIENLTIKDVKMQSIELTRTDIPNMEETTVKIEKSARLQTHEVELQKQIDDKSAKKKNVLKGAMKSAKERQVSRGNVVTKVTIDIKGPAKQSYVIEQHSGEIFSDTRLNFDKSALEMIKVRTTLVGTPEFIERALIAQSTKTPEEFMSVALASGANKKLIGSELLEENFELSKTIDESDAITELKEKLNLGEGRDVAPKTIEVTPATAAEVKKEEVKKEETSTLVPSEVAQAPAAKKS